MTFYIFNHKTSLKCFILWLTHTHARESETAMKLNWKARARNNNIFFLTLNQSERVSEWVRIVDWKASEWMNFALKNYQDELSRLLMKATPPTTIKTCCCGGGEISKAKVHFTCLHPSAQLSSLFEIWEVISFFSLYFMCRLKHLGLYHRSRVITRMFQQQEKALKCASKLILFLERHRRCLDVISMRMTCL